MTREPEDWPCLQGLDAMDWAGLDHAYGDATDVPGALRALTSLDKEARDKAWMLLYGSVIHQGSLYSATGVVLPFLVRMLDDDRVEDATGLLKFLGSVGGAVYDCLCSFKELPEEPGAVEMASADTYLWEVSRPCLDTLTRSSEVVWAQVGHPDPDRRLAAHKVLVWILRFNTVHARIAGHPYNSDGLCARLIEHVDREADSLACGGMVAALARANGEVSKTQEDVRRWLLPPHPYPARLAAAEALLENGEPENAAIALALVDSLAHWDAYYDEDDDHGSERRHVVIWAWMRDSLRGLLYFGSRWYDPTAACETVSPTWTPFPHSPAPWMWGTPNSSPPLPVSAIGQIALARLQKWTCDPCLVVRSRASQLLLEFGYGGQQELETILQALGLPERVPFRAAVKAAGRAGEAAGAAVPLLLQRLDSIPELRGDTTEGAEFPYWPKSDAELILEALGAIGAQAQPAAGRLLELAISAQDPRVAAAAASALRATSLPAVFSVKLFAILLNDPNPIHRRRSAEFIVELPGESDEEAIAVLLEVITRDAATVVRLQAADSLLHIAERTPSAAVALPRVLDDFLSNPPVRSDAGMTGSERQRLWLLWITCLTRGLPSRRAVQALVRELELGQCPVAALAEAIGELGPDGADALPHLLRKLAEPAPEAEDAIYAPPGPNWEHRVPVLDCIARIGTGAGHLFESLLPYLSNDETGVAAARTLYLLGAPTPLWLPFLRNCAATSDERTGILAAEVLWESGLDEPLAHETVMTAISAGWYDLPERAALAMIPMGISCLDAAPMLWKRIVDDFAAREAQVTGNPFEWVEGVTFAFAGALWGMGLRSQATLDILTYGLCSKSRYSTFETVMEVMERLGNRARPFIPALRALAEGRLDVDRRSEWARHAARILANIEEQNGIEPL